MIIVCFGDGLGNQMFQYAFYYSLKKKSTCSVLADIDNFYGSVNKHNGFELKRIFDVPIEEASYKKALQLADYNSFLVKQHPLLCMLWGIKRVISGPKDCYILPDDPSVYYPSLFQLDPLKSYMLRGNWISEEYFREYSDDIKRIFSFPVIESTDENFQVAKKIMESNSVSIHIRAGDFINNDSFVSLNKNYYMEAIQRIESEEKVNHLYFVFSDDVSFSQQILGNMNNVTYISNNKGKNSYKDMQLMSMCKNNIIANSTFSFWGAYLNNRKGKIVIAPKIASKNCKNPFACQDWVLL